MGSRAGDGRVSPTGVLPGAPTDLLSQVAATPEQREAEPPPLLPWTVVGLFEILRQLDADLAFLERQTDVRGGKPWP